MIEHGFLDKFLQPLLRKKREQEEILKHLSVYGIESISVSGLLIHVKSPSSVRKKELLLQKEVIEKHLHAATGNSYELHVR